MIDALALAVAAIQQLADDGIHVDWHYAELEVRRYTSGGFYAELSYLHRFFPFGCAHPDVRRAADFDVCQDCFKIVKGTEGGEQDNRKAVSV